MGTKAELCFRGVVALRDIPLGFWSPRGISIPEVDAAVGNFGGRGKLQPEDMVGDDIRGKVTGELGAWDQLVHEAVFFTFCTYHKFGPVKGKCNL